jgi:hypothetical protein
MLAKALGSGPKSLYTANISSGVPPPPPPIGTTGNGTCGATNFGGDCDLDPTGAWDARKEGILNLSACVARARGCKMAKFVSFSLAKWNSDCSWYASCDFGHLCEDCSKCGIGCPSYVPYTSEVIKGPAAGWETVPDKALSCASSEYRGSLGAFDTGDECLAAVKKSTSKANYAVWNTGGGGGNKGCFICAITSRGEPSTWPLNDAPGAVSFIGPPLPPTAKLFPLPYEVHASGARGLLLVSKSSKPMRVQLQGAGLTDTAATVLDGTLDGVTLDPEPGFVAPLVRRVGSDGSLALGPYAIALVDAGQAAPMSADSSKA